jgi:hypothetical protein
VLEDIVLYSPFFVVALHLQSILLSLSTITLKTLSRVALQPAGPLPNDLIAHSEVLLQDCPYYYIHLDLSLNQVPAEISEQPDILNKLLTEDSAWNLRQQELHEC